MGYLRATEMISFAGLEAALYDHIRRNCYPPLPLALMPAAKQAIERAIRDDDTPVPMPSGISHRRYGDQVPPIVMVEELHLVTMIHLFNDLHSGGGSRGYRLLCLALRAYARRYHPGQHGVHPLDMKLGGDIRRLYMRLETAWMNA